MLSYISGRQGGWGNKKQNDTIWRNFNQNNQIFFFDIPGYEIQLNAMQQHARKRTNKSARKTQERRQIVML